MELEFYIQNKNKLLATALGLCAIGTLAIGGLFLAGASLTLLPYIAIPVLGLAFVFVLGYLGLRCYEKHKKMKVTPKQDENIRQGSSGSYETPTSITSQPTGNNPAESPTNNGAPEQKMTYATPVTQVSTAEQISSNPLSPVQQILSELKYDIIPSPDQNTIENDIEKKCKAIHDLIQKQKFKPSWRARLKEPAKAKQYIKLKNFFEEIKLNADLFKSSQINLPRISEDLAPEEVIRVSGQLDDLFQALNYLQGILESEDNKPGKKPYLKTLFYWTNGYGFLNSNTNSNTTHHSP